jgi:hypothetical protein
MNLRDVPDAGLQAVLRERREEAEQMRVATRNTQSAISAIEREVARRYAERLTAEFTLTREHILLLKRMRFEGLWCGDTVSIGVNGKRPFGNSDVHHDVATILGWELDHDAYDSVSTEQHDAAQRLLDELPLALNAIIAGL